MALMRKLHNPKCFVMNYTKPPFLLAYLIFKGALSYHLRASLQGSICWLHQHIVKVRPQGFLPPTQTRKIRFMTSTIPAASSLNKFEKLKAEKDGLAVKAELDEFARLGWEAMDETDRDYRLKWLGVFFRPVTPGKFMMRLRLPNGIVTSAQLRVLGDVVQRYGEDGNADITTRQNIQLRGVRIEDLPDIFRRFEQAGLTSIQSGMDNVRNITGSPIAGLDGDELIDTRELALQLQDMITNAGQGNPKFSNLPRKFNIAIDGSRDNAIHAEINDIAFVPAYQNQVLGFNVLVGGFFSGKRCAAAIPLNAWVEPDRVVALCEAILLVYRDHGLAGQSPKVAADVADRRVGR